MDIRPNLSCASDVMNEAFIEFSDEELDEGFKILSRGPDLDVSYSNNSKCSTTCKDNQQSSTDGNKCKSFKEATTAKPLETSEVFKPTCTRKSSTPCHFKFPNLASLDDPRCLSETDKFPVSRRSSEISVRFSPLDDISNIKLEQPTSSEVLRSFISKDALTTISTLDDIRIPEHSKENIPENTNFTKTKCTMTEGLHFKENKETKQPFKELKSINCTKQRPAVHLRKQIPVPTRNTKNKLPMLKSEESTLKSKLESPGSANKKLAIKTISGLKCFTPNPSAKCSERRKSLQHENQLREDRRLAEKKHRKSVSTLVRGPKDSNLKHEGKILKKKMPHVLDLSTIEKSCSHDAPTHPEKERLIRKCADIMSASQNEKIDALAKEPGILEVSDLTLCSNTVYFSRIFNDTFEFPKKI